MERQRPAQSLYFAQHLYPYLTSPRRASFVAAFVFLAALFGLLHDRVELSDEGRPPMAMTYDTALVEAIGPDEGVALWVKRAVLVALGIAVLALAAKAKIMVPPSPVPITLGTLAVLTIGAAYGPRLGLVTILGYLLIGAAGYDIFASSSAENSGLAYMIGTSGGYLVGYVLAVMYLGWAARRGLDRSVEGMGGCRV